MSGRVLLIWAASLLTVLSLTTSGCNVVRITLNGWLRIDNTDIGEVECLPDLNDNLPSTQAGRVGLEQ